MSWGTPEEIAFDRRRFHRRFPCALYTKKAKKRKRFCNLFLVDKCLSVGYNMLKFFGGYMTMTARFSTTYSSTRCTMAAACSSARISPILDTAMILAVSICVVRLLLAAAA